MLLKKRPIKIFYGWWIVGACFLTTLFAGGFVVLSFTALFEPIVKEFGWSYTQVSLAASLQSAELGLMSPLVGFLIDRWGPRRLLLGGALVLGFGMVFLSRITNLAMFYCAFILLAIGYSFSSGTTLYTAVANWFRQKMGMASGIVACGFALGSVLVPFVSWLIDVFDWRQAILFLGLLVCLTNLPLSFVVRHKPEQYGYLPDGDTDVKNTFDDTAESLRTQDEEGNVTLKEALRGRVFWHLTLALTFQFLAVNTVVIHVMPYLSSIGIPRSMASLIAASTPFVSIAGRLSAGWLSDKWDKRITAAGFAACICVALLIFSQLTSEVSWLVAVYVVLMGIGWGGFTPLRSAMLRDYFGRRHYGIILGGIAGPLFAGWVFDIFQGYRNAWLVLSVVAFSALVVMATTPRKLSRNSRIEYG